MNVFRYIVGAFFWLEGVINVIFSFSPPNQVFSAVIADQAKLPAYDAHTYEDPESKP